MRNVTCGEEEVASAGLQICNLFRGDDYLQALHPKVIFVHLIHFCQIYGGTPMSFQKTLVMLSASFYILISLDILYTCVENA